MLPDLTDIARGRRIVALAARDLSLLRRSSRPVRRWRWLALLRRMKR